MHFQAPRLILISRGALINYYYEIYLINSNSFILYDIQYVGPEK